MELYHYGVKGMRWGVRRTPEQLGHRRYRAVKGHYKLEKYTSPNRETAKKVSKIVAINAAKTAANMAVPELGLVFKAYSLYNAYNTVNNVRNRLDGKDYTKTEGSYEKLSKLKKKNIPSDIIDDLTKVNPRFGNQKGKVNNCGYCAVAMEMRARGYDVRARSKAQGMVSEKELPRMFDNVKFENPKLERTPNESRQDYVQRSYNNLCNQIGKYGNNTRGYVSIQYEKGNFGHAMFYKVDNDRVTFYDGQNKSINPDRVFALADPTKHQFARLDHLKLKEAVTEAVISNKDEGVK